MFEMFRRDLSAVIWNRPYEEWVDVPSVQLPLAEGVLWAPGGAATERYMVEFLVINNDAGGAVITGCFVGRDVNAGGALGRPEYWMFDETVFYPGTSGWRGPFFMDGNDTIRGTAWVANDASVHFRVRRVDLYA